MNVALCTSFCAQRHIHTLIRTAALGRARLEVTMVRDECAACRLP